MSQPQLPPDAQLLNLMFGKTIASSLGALAKLAVADHMSPGEFRDVAAISAHSGTDEASLYRVLRVLASVGVFAQDGRAFRLTEVGELLRTDHPRSLRNLNWTWFDEWRSRAYENLAETLQTGTNGVQLAYGKHAWDHFKDFPEQGRLFSEAMTSFSRASGAAILDAYDFSGIERLADVGGGHGMLLSSILGKYPSISGVLFDLPHVIEQARAAPHTAGLGARLSFEPGSFMENVPSGCDAYIMKHIIHDWHDEGCLRILHMIREKLPAHGRVLVCDMVVNETPEPSPAKLLDIEMLACTEGGKERTAREFAELLSTAGFRLERIVPTAGPICVIEGRP
jgi:hypothetical protein